MSAPIVVDLPNTQYTLSRPFSPAPRLPGSLAPLPSGPALARPSLSWLSLALAIAVAGLALAALCSALGLLSLSAALGLALWPANTGLGIALGMFITEVVLCHAPC